MSNRLALSVERLKATIGAQDPQQAHNLLDQIEQYFDDELSGAEQDLAIDKLFGGFESVLGFLRASLTYTKTFKKVNVKFLELFAQLIITYKRKVVQYADEVVTVCLQYILIEKISAAEKEKATLVIHEIVSNKLCDYVDKSKLLTELFKIFDLKKPPGTLLHRVYELIGLLAREYPDCMTPDEEPTRIKDMYFQTLEKTLINQEHITYSALTGALNGFRYFLTNFTPLPEILDEFSQRLYTCIKKLSDPPADMIQRAPFRAALHLLTEHSEIFAEHIFGDWNYWHRLLTDTWLNRKWEDRRTAIYLLHAIHKEIAAQIVQRKDRNDQPILQYFNNYFKATLQSANSQSYEIRIAIRGFGVMAGPCKEIMDQQHIDQLLTLIMQRTENASNEIDKVDKEQLEHFPDLVQALSEIMNHIDELSGIQICTMQNIMISLMRHFHYLSRAHHSLVVQSLIKTFYNLSRLGDTVLDDVLYKVIYQGVIWTCSHQLVHDAKGDWDTLKDWKEHLTYEFYLPLWTGLLTDTEHSNFDRPSIVRKIYEHFMKTLFRLLEKLNLATRKRVHRNDLGIDQELYFCDPNYDLEPIKAKDFHIFFNVVEFYEAILLKQSQKSHMDNFTQWIKQYFETMITRSFRYPLVSGFYKFMRLGMGIANSIDYFTDEMDMEGDQTLADVSEFFKNTIGMAQQAVGELQLACLRFLFSAPMILLRPYILDLIPVFVIALELGKTKSVMSIVHTALTAIEKYIELTDSSPNELREFLQAVLPHLDPYLQGLTNEGTTSATVQLVQKRGVSQPKRLLKVTESHLVNLQKRIVLFLGKLEPEHCLLLVANDQTANLNHLNLVKWDVKNYISLTLYAPGVHPLIYLDSLMPHICDIALNATERQKKMAACEIVHSVILYLIGNNKHNGKLWSEIFQCTLHLGCDGDFAVQQMFEPLILQIMHYLSQPNQMINESVKNILNCLMGAISNPNKSAVRDLSARCLREFLQWTIKHIEKTPDERNVSQANIRSLIEIIKLFSFDSSQHKRHGAALAFNNVYRVLREEETIIDQYWLDLLYTFCFNFATSEEFAAQNNMLVNVEQAGASLDHVVRVLKERSHIFNRPNNLRIKPRVLSDGCQLKHAVLWLFQQCGSRHTKYRSKMIQMFNELVTCVDGCNSATAFVHEHYTIVTIIELCEGRPDGISARPNLNHVKESKLPITLIYNWLEHLLATLDCYTWLIGKDLIRDAESLLKHSAIFNVARYFLDSLMLPPIMDLLLNIDPNVAIEYDIGNREKIPLIKCSILAKIFEFLIKLLPTYRQYIPPSFWLNNGNLTKIISKSIFDPFGLGFDLKNKDEYRHFPEHIELLIRRISDYAPDDFVRSFQNELSKITSTKYKAISDVSQQILRLQNVATKQFIVARGIETVFRLSRHFKYTDDLQQFLNISAAKTLYELFAGVAEESPAGPYALNGAPDTVQYSNHVMRISLYKENIYVELIDLILNWTELRTAATENAQTTRQGKHFLNLHKNSIFEYFAKMPDVIIGRLRSRITTPQNTLYILKIFIDFTDYVYRNKQHDKPMLKNIAHTLLDNWSLIYLKSQSVDGTAVTLALIELLTSVVIIYPKNLTDIATEAEGFQEWCLNIIATRETRLEIKSQAIVLLPCIVNHEHTEHLPVTKALNKLQEHHFPLHSAEFREGSIERASFMNVFQALLDALCASRSSVILKFLINSTTVDVKHIMEYKIQLAIAKFIKLQTPEQQVKSLKIPFELFCNKTIEPSNRVSVMHRFLIAMLRNCLTNAVLTFFTENMKKIRELSDCSYCGGLGSWDQEHGFVSRTGAYELIEVLFGLFTHPIDKNQIKPITAAYLGVEEPKKDDEIVGELSRKAYNVRKETFSTSNASFMELYRKYQCAAYKALCVIVSNTQEILTIYEKLLFTETSASNQLIWKKIINITDDNLYTDLTVEIDKNPKIKDRFVSIKRLQENSTTIGQQTPRYIESQHVFDSSLSQDVTKIDLSLSAIRTDSEVATMQLTNAPITIRLEKNSINDHEVMASICAVIQHIFEKNITPVEANNTRIHAPVWVKSICKALTDVTYHKNIRFFLAMVVDNCRHQFRNYAPQITVAILKVLNTDCFNKCIDAFVIYLTVTLLEWNEVYQIETDEEIRLASKLIENLMEYAWNDRKIVFKKNLDVIKNLMEIWRDIIILPRQLLYDSLRCSANIESRDNMRGIQLNGIVLANNLLPWIDEADAFKNYLTHLAKCIDNNHTSVYQPASQVLGMALSKIAAFDASHLNDQLENIRKMGEKKFTDVLYGIHKYFPPVIDNFFTRITGYISISTGAIKRIYLEMFLSRIHIFQNDQYREVMAMGILQLLKNKEYQLLALHIVNKILPTLIKDEIEILLPHICAFSTSKSSECRAIMYEICIYIHKNFKNSLDVSTAPILLNGLTEPDALIQGTIYNFWTKEAQIPSELNKRMEVSFKHLYHPDVEGRFLNYCAQLLLQPSIEHKSSAHRIVNCENVGAKPIEYEINISWKTQNSVFTTPLFMESQQKNILSGDSMGHHFLRATVADEDLHFQPTLQPENIYQSLDNFPLRTQSSLLFSGQTQILDRRSQRIDVPHSQAKATVAAGSAPMTKQQKYFQSLRSRILRDPEQMSRAMALRAIERHGYEAIREVETQKRSENSITLYRRYRKGDYPDFQLSSLSLLMPLQALAKLDQTVARKLLVIIFEGIVNEIGTEQRSFLLTMNDCIKTIFMKTKNYDSVLFTTLIEIALQHPDAFNFQPDVLATISNANSTMAMGILFMESRLNLNCSTERRVHPSSENSIDNETEHWVKLADMYYNLSEYDIVADIFADKLRKDAKLTQAIELEAHGDFSRAIDLYTDIIREYDDADRTPPEVVFAYQSIYNCYMNMGMWEKLLKHVEDQLKDNDGQTMDIELYEQLWTEDWNMEHLLPHYIRCELRTTLNQQKAEQSFIDNMEAWLRNKDREAHIKHNFAEELMMLKIADNMNFLEARVYSEEHILRFLSEWNNLNVLSDKVRANKILNIRNVAEIHRYSDWFVADVLDSRILTKLTNRWQNIHIHSSDSISMWDSLIAYRNYIHQVGLQIFNDEIDSDRRTALVESVFNMQFSLIDAALQQNNLLFSSNLIRQIEQHIVEDAHDLISAEWHLASSKLLIHKSQSFDVENDESLKYLFDAWNSINETVRLHATPFATYPELQAKALTQTANIAGKLIDQLPDVVNDKITAVIVQRTSTSTKESLNDRLYEHSIQSLQSAITIAEYAENGENEDGMQVVPFRKKSFIGETYQKLAMFCLEHLGARPTIEQQKNVIIYVLRGMRHDSKEGHLQFPRILQLTNVEDFELAEKFDEEVVHVPEWMFLKWIPQILSSLNFRGTSFLDKLVLRLAMAYPSAMIYPFQLSLAQYYRKYPHPYNRELINQLVDLLRNPLAEKLIQGMQCLCMPEKMLVAHLVKIDTKLRKQQSFTPQRFHDDIEHLVKVVYQNNLQGTVFEAIQPFKASLEQLLAAEVSDDMQIEQTAIHDLIKKVSEVQTHTSRLTLKSFCPAFEQFQWYGSENGLELPGQYRGDSSPNINQHVKIFRFNANIKIYHSLRKPMKITIYGSNAKQYDYLVKYGEDLRQDERIQQLMDLMSRQLNADKNCRNHKMSLQTYQVIPFDAYCGMLSFVNDTVSINDIIIEAFERQNEKYFDVLKEIKSKYEKFIRKPSENLPESDRNRQMIVYGTAASKYSRDELIKNFISLVDGVSLKDRVPPELIKSALMAISNSPESFFVLRNNFAISLATMNIANWILGIGDRHLSNILINKKTGRVIGIDYGVAFGAGIRDQTIPEMIPFRLTSQFTGAVAPLETTGIIKKSMIHALRVFRAEWKLIMACTEVFVKEPTIDWLETVYRLRYADEESLTSDDSDWDPNKRLKMVKDKLTGYNPMQLLLDEMEHSRMQSNFDFMDGYTKIIKGDKKSIRSDLKPNKLSVEEQVSCLIEMAQDKAMLGISYAGLQPWL